MVLAGMLFVKVLVVVLAVVLGMVVLGCYGTCWYATCWHDMLFYQSDGAGSQLLPIIIKNIIVFKRCHT